MSKYAFCSDLLSIFCDQIYIFLYTYFLNYTNLIIKLEKSYKFKFILLNLFYHRNWSSTIDKDSHYSKN